VSNNRREQIRNYVERACAALDNIDYYRLLNVSSAANDEQIRVAYYKLAASLHPDVHGVDVEPAYRAKLTAVFSRVAEAYKVLADPALRARYDRELARGNLRMSMGADVSESGPKINTPSAQRFFKLAEAAISSGDKKSAIMNLRFALQVEPDNPDIQAELKKIEGS
jgi:curved DNA-binding protein CbpA